MSEPLVSFEDFLALWVEYIPTASGRQIKLLSATKVDSGDEKSDLYEAVICAVQVEGRSIVARIPKSSRLIFIVWTPETFVLRLESHLGFGTQQEDDEPLQTLRFFADDINSNEAGRISKLIACVREEDDEITVEVTAGVYLPAWLWSSRVALENFAVRYMADLIRQFSAETESSCDDLGYAVADIADGDSDTGGDEEPPQVVDDPHLEGGEHAVDTSDTHNVPLAEETPPPFNKMH